MINLSLFFQDKKNQLIIQDPNLKLVFSSQLKPHAVTENRSIHLSSWQRRFAAHLLLHRRNVGLHAGSPRMIHFFPFSLSGERTCWKQVRSTLIRFDGNLSVVEYSAITGSYEVPKCVWSLKKLEQREKKRVAFKCGKTFTDRHSRA